MKFDKVQFVYIDMDYLKKLNEIEPEIFFDAKNKNYKEKINIIAESIKENQLIKNTESYKNLILSKKYIKK